MRRWALYFHLVSKAEWEWGGGDTEKNTSLIPKLVFYLKKEASDINPEHFHLETLSQNWLQKYLRLIFPAENGRP